LTPGHKPTSIRRSLKNLGRRLFPRRLKVTREGKIYVVVTLGVGFAAINTNNNLLFLVFGLMLGLIIASGILSELTLRNIEVRRALPRHAEAGIPFPVELALKNLKPYAPSFGIELRDEIDDKPFRRRCFFLRVGTDEERSIAYRCELMKRGRTNFDGIIVATRFPFGLFEKSRFVALTDEIIVLPAYLPVQIPLRFNSRIDAGAESTTVRGSGHDFRELREMSPGDDPRRIHWKTTARFGRPFIRENNIEAHGFVDLVLDPTPPAPGQSGFDQAERNIEATGTIIRDYIRKGFLVRLTTPANIVLEAKAREEAFVLLEHLALIDTSTAGESPAPMGQSSFSILIGPRARTRGEEGYLTIPTVPPQPSSLRRG
jgi:uncharacterized protein (DUF58 family)